MASVLGLATGCTRDTEFDATPAAAASNDTSTPPDTADDLLFVVRSSHGRLVLYADGTGTLTMDGIEDVTWFSDRPARDAGVTTMREALRSYGWRDDGDAVSADAPNATLTAPELGDDALVVELLVASVDGDRVSFEVQTVSDSPARDDELSDLDLFIDTTTGTADSPTDRSTTVPPDPAGLAVAAGFDTRAPLADHLSGLLLAATADAGADAGQDRTVELAVRASTTLDAGGDRTSVPVLLVPPQRVGFDPAEVARQIEAWLTATGARIDTLVFDVTIGSTDPPRPVLVVQDVELPLRNVDLTT